MKQPFKYFGIFTAGMVVHQRLMILAIKHNKSSRHSYNKLSKKQERAVKFLSNFI